jgi:hypothetical protein
MAPELQPTVPPGTKDPGGADTGQVASTRPRGVIIVLAVALSEGFGRRRGRRAASDLRIVGCGTGMSLDVLGGENSRSSRAGDTAQVVNLTPERTTDDT